MAIPTILDKGARHSTNILVETCYLYRETRLRAWRYPGRFHWPARDETENPRQIVVPAKRNGGVNRHTNCSAENSADVLAVEMLERKQDRWLSTNASAGVQRRG